MSPALLIHGVTVLLAVAIALRVGARRDKSDLHWLLLAVLASAVLWSTGEGVRAAIDAPVWRRAALRVSFLGVMSLPAFWLLLAGRYARVPWLVGRPGIYAVLLAPSVAGYLALLTNDAHHGIIREVVGQAPGPRSWAGPLFWIFLIWAYVCSIWGSCLYVPSIRRLRAEGERLRSVGLAFAAFGPLALGLLAILGLPPRGTSPTPIGVALSMLVLSAILRYRLLQHVPLDHRDVIEHLREGAIMASASGVVLDLNPSAERLLERSREQVAGVTLGDVVALLVREDERDALRRRLGCLEDMPMAIRSELETPDGGRIGLLASCASAVAEAWPRLSSPDPYLRHAARIAIESQPAELWIQRALAETDPLGSIEAWLALARAGDSSARDPLLERVLRAPWNDASTERRVDLLRVLDRVLVHLGDPDPESARRLREGLEARFPSGAASVDRALAELLVYLRAPSLPARALARIAAAQSQEEAIHFGFLLRLARDGWTAELRAQYFAWWNEALTSYQGGESLRNYLLAARAEALAGLDARELEELGPLRDPPAPVSSGPAAGTSQPFVRAWTRGELQPQMTRLGDARDLARGAELYRRGTCLDCHRIAGEGGSDGPDLTHAGARFSGADLLETILRPNETIPDQYRDTEVWTRGGRLIVGTVVEESDGELTIRTRGQEARLETVAKEEIELRRPTPLSRMPEGLLNTFELEEILDLFAYVLAERR